VGIVSHSSATTGSIEVNVVVGDHLEWLHDVLITTPTNGQVLKYDSTSGLWVNGTDVGGVAWGGITGTLSSQTDLQTALDGKYSTTNPSGFITSSALTGYATESFVTSQGYITSAALSPYLLSSTAASTYYLQTNPAGYINATTLGNGSAPAGEDILDGLQNAVAPSTSNPYATEGYTDSSISSFAATVAGTYATIASVPAFATDAQLIAASSTTTVISPNAYRLAGLTTNVWSPAVSSLSAGNLGTGSNAGSSYTALNGRLLAPSASTAGYATRGFTLHYSSNSAAASTNFGMPSGHSIRVYTGWNSTVAGVKIRSVFGRMGGSLPVPAPLAVRGYGWEWDWSNRTMNIIAHDGTTLTTTAVTWNPLLQRTYEIMALSNGAGTISLYVDGVLLGTSTGGPTTPSGTSVVWWQTEIQNEATAGAQLDFFYQNPKMFTTNG
jgi:hypothetical protein